MKSKPFKKDPIPGIQKQGIKIILPGIVDSMEESIMDGTAARLKRTARLLDKQKRLSRIMYKNSKR